MIPLQRITFGSQIHGGPACIPRMRIPGSVIVKQIAHGATRDEVLADYLDLEPEEVQESLECAGRRAGGQVETAQMMRSLENTVSTENEIYLLDVYGAPVSYDDLQRIQRDILLLFHQSMNDGGLGAVYRSWGVIFDLPYWRFVGLHTNADAERPGIQIISSDDLQLVRQGCMVAAIDMYLDHYYKPDEYMAEHLQEYEAAFVQQRPTDSNETRLNTIARATLELACRGASPGNAPDLLEQRVFDGANWAFQCVVQGYYRHMVPS